MVGTESYPRPVLSELARRLRPTAGSSAILCGPRSTTWASRASATRSMPRAKAAGPAAAVSPAYPWFNAYCGDIDLIGNKKPQSYFRDVVWRRSKVEMAVQRPIPEGYAERIGGWGWSDEMRSWTWPGFEGAPLTVRVYTRGDKVSALPERQGSGLEGSDRRTTLSRRSSPFPTPPAN